MPKEYQSKYWRKTNEEITYNLEECGCTHCGKWFMIDYAHLPPAEIDGDDDFAKITCPYCGNYHYEHL